MNFKNGHFRVLQCFRVLENPRDGGSRLLQRSMALVNSNTRSSRVPE